MQNEEYGSNFADYIDRLCVYVRLSAQAEAGTVRQSKRDCCRDAEWREVPEEGDDTMRFFKVEVEMP